jgi:hypothetical protein
MAASRASIPAAALSFIMVSLSCLATSCVYFWGPNVPREIEAQHLSTQQVYGGTTIGTQWLPAMYSANGAEFGQGGSRVIELLSWEEFTLTCTHVENDNEYPDTGVGSFSMPVWQMLRDHGPEFTVIV